MKKNYIINGNSADRRTLSKVEDGSIDLLVTSPPYLKQRKYGEGEELIWGGKIDCIHDWIMAKAWRKISPGDKPSSRSEVAARRPDSVNRPDEDSYYCKECGAWYGDLGMEPDVTLYVEHLVGIFDAWKPKLKETGNLVVNIGDKMNGGGGAGSQYSKWRKKHTQFGKNTKGIGQSFPIFVDEYPRASHLCVPEQFLIAMRDKKWYVERPIIWQKITPTPSSDKRNFTIDYEFIFWFAKTNDYHFKQQLVPRKSKGSGQKFGGKKAPTYGNPVYSGRSYAGGRFRNMRSTWKGYDGIAVVDEPYLQWLEGMVFGSRGMDMSSLWKIGTSKYRGKHHATFPPELVQRCIDAFCPEEGLVVDIFGGVGNSAIAACEMNRDWILVELFEEYSDVAAKRIAKHEKFKQYRKATPELDDL